MGDMFFLFCTSISDWKCIGCGYFFVEMHHADVGHVLDNGVVWQSRRMSAPVAGGAGVAAFPAQIPRQPDAQDGGCRYGRHCVVRRDHCRQNLDP